jgi:hypothetical protein
MSVEDRLAILDVIARYALAWDGRDAEAYAACFTDDAVFEDWIKGRDEPLNRLETREAIGAWAAAGCMRVEGRTCRAARTRWRRRSTS